MIRPPQDLEYNISLKEYIQDLHSEYTQTGCLDDKTYLTLIHDYIDFQNQHLTLGMFLPTDDKGELLDYRAKNTYCCDVSVPLKDETKSFIDKYRKALGSTLFDCVLLHQDLTAIHLSVESSDGESRIITYDKIESCFLQDMTTIEDAHHLKFKYRTD